MSNIDYIKFKQLYNNKELMHHGIKGQKWGVRKDKDKSSNERDKSSNEYKMFKEQQRALNKAAATEVKRRKKIIRTAGAILIGGAIVASLLINKHKKEKISVMNNSPAKETTQLLTNTMQNVGKDTYVDDLLKEARRKRSTFRDMKDMLHHSGIIDETYLEHFGILGQKWGIRRYQNEDGTLTEAGKERYYKDIIKNGDMKKVQNAIMGNKNISNMFLDSADKYEKFVKAKTNLYNNVEKKLDDIAYDKKYDFNNLPPYDENPKLWHDTEQKWARDIHNKYVEIVKNPNIEKMYMDFEKADKEYSDSLHKLEDSIVGKDKLNKAFGTPGLAVSALNFNGEIKRLQSLAKNLDDKLPSPSVDYVRYDVVKDMDPLSFIYMYTVYQFVD